MSGDASSILAGKGFYALPAKRDRMERRLQLFDRCQIVRNCPIMPLSSCSRI